MATAKKASTSTKKTKSVAAKPAPKGSSAKKKTTTTTTVVAKPSSSRPRSKTATVKSSSLSGMQVLSIVVIAFITFVFGFYVGEMTMKNKIAQSLKQALNALTVQGENAALESIDQEVASPSLEIGLPE